MPGELLRFATAGSVDDGKSTLIGRLLYDSKTLFIDQLEAVERVSRERGDDYTDLALLTDGLRAEREQGITIDVAYRYFATPRRKFIIADTPGHIQYTRNMVTGCSTADVALILLDARKGITEQSRRHAFLATLLGVPHLVVCVNKMDLVDFSEERFEDIRDEFEEFATRLRVRDMTFIPISALLGDNVVTRSSNMSWYDGAPLLSHLEHLHVASDRNLVDVRFPVQYVVRPQSFEVVDYRGYAGTLASGVMKPGDEVLARPGGRGVPADGRHDHAQRRHRPVPRRHAVPAPQRAVRRPGPRRPGVLDGRERAADRGSQVPHQAHDPLGQGAGQGDRLSDRRQHPSPRRSCDRAGAQRDRAHPAPGHPAAVRGPVPAEPGNRRLHPRRRGHPQDRRGRHDRADRHVQLRSLGRSAAVAPTVGH
jgi:small GTP-binding protein